MAIAPMDAVGSASKMGRQVRPAFSVFHTPPPTAPNRYSLGLPGTPSAGSTRPPRNGPIMRHCISGKGDGASCCCGNACGGQKIAMTETIATKMSARNFMGMFIVFFARGVYTIGFRVRIERLRLVIFRGRRQSRRAERSAGPALVRRDGEIVESQSEQRYHPESLGLDRKFRLKRKFRGALYESESPVVLVFSPWAVHFDVFRGSRRPRAPTRRPD